MGGIRANGSGMARAGFKLMLRPASNRLYWSAVTVNQVVGSPVVASPSFPDSAGM